MSSRIRPRRRIGPQGRGTTLVAEAMHPGVVTCSPHASLAVAARIMAAHRIHAVVVAEPRDSGYVVRGVVSDRDVLEALAEGDAAARTAGEVAARPLALVTPIDPLDRAIALMRGGHTHVVVVDPVTRHPVGVVSTLDVAELVARDA